MRAAVRRFLRNRRGATAIEYALIASLVFLALLGGLSAYNNAMTGKYKFIAEKLEPPLT